MEREKLNLTKISILPDEAESWTVWFRKYPLNPINTFHDDLESKIAIMITLPGILPVAFMVLLCGFFEWIRKHIAPHSAIRRNARNSERMAPMLFKESWIKEHEQLCKEQGLIQVIKSRMVTAKRLSSNTKEP